MYQYFIAPNIQCMTEKIAMALHQTVSIASKFVCAQKKGIGLDMQRVWSAGNLTEVTLHIYYGKDLVGSFRMCGYDRPDLMNVYVAS